MADSINPNTSIALYRYMCHNIVGSEDHVKHIRSINAVRDNLQSNKYLTFITSGSFGEGLEMRGSDLDIMMVLHKLCEVFENIKTCFNPEIEHVIIEIDDVKPCYALLRLDHYINPDIFNYCEEHNGKQYFSSALHKQCLLSDFSKKIHGPCISDKDGYFDYAISLHCKTWISPALQWITRSSNSWSSDGVKQSIIKHGVLFVPIGVKGSPNEDIEWRVSFSVGEKLLINTFTHSITVLCSIQNYFERCNSNLFRM
ncbi:Hypothetical predicted protein [Mytilus galloprovincialis]|uniref:Mab-21-like nucleotidyltransferase domain-containing protein n=1 Tax=Mytilus galloprovincialis TaxID=29158 RepID=A0A8B6GAM6_MYTGA|nr:Hypothetical predicted protein [Mytilus galloprovincialis]